MAIGCNESEPQKGLSMDVTTLAAGLAAVWITTKLLTQLSIGLQMYIPLCWGRGLRRNRNESPAKSDRTAERPSSIKVTSTVPSLLRVEAMEWDYHIIIIIIALVT